jgi:hypothetical protein
VTLDSRVYINSPKLSAREVLTRMQQILGKYDERNRAPEQMKTWIGADHVSNEGDQGLPAWVMVHHNGERPIWTEGQECTDSFCLKYPEDNEDGCYHSGKGPHWLCVSMDTAYGYDGNGMGCGDLHALMIAELGQWLDEKQAPWSWQNEFTGEIHGGADKYARLIDLASGGFEATAWFRTSALPAIVASIAEEQS